MVPQFLVLPHSVIFRYGKLFTVILLFACLIAFFITSPSLDFKPREGRGLVCLLLHDISGICPADSRRSAMKIC